jgi:plasmid stabilization system protein ParE
MAKIHFHPEAQVEYRRDLLRYFKRSRRAASGFQRAVSHMTSQIASDPLAYPSHSGEVRHADLIRYPYSLIYRIEANGNVLIVAVAHASREPGYWQGRVP